jgi:AcrR family transcriptional regulator
MHDTLPIEAAQEPTTDPRVAAILDAALPVFLRFGYRKTSMQDVAAAADISRQGLYLHFPGKEQLFRAVAIHHLTRGLAAARVALAADTPLTERVPEAFDIWMGQFVGIASSDASDLAEIGHALIGADVQAYETQFAAALTQAIEGSSVAPSLAARGISAADSAQMLLAVGRGSKHSVATRAEFRAHLALATRILCASSAGSC